VAGYIVVKCGLAAGRDEVLAEVLSEFQVLGAQIETIGRGLTSVLVYAPVSEAASTQELARSLAAVGATDVTVEWLADRDWLDEYRRQAQPFSVGTRWWVDPVPGSVSLPPCGRIPLVVEPSCAFGSGSHESTQLMLCHLEVLEVENRLVLDVGTGSGILALAAHRLGANRVVGLDVDSRAVFVARRTLRRQIPPVSVLLVAGTLGGLGGRAFDAVLCNVLWETQQGLLADLRRLLAQSGSLVLAGFLKSEEEEVVAELEAVHLAVSGRRELGDWLLLEARHG